MSKKNYYLLGIVLTIGLGMLLYNYFCCGACCDDAKATTDSGVVTSNSPESIFSLKGKDFDYHCNGNFNFLNNDFKTLLPVADSINIGIEQLKTNFESGGKKLDITGYCLSSEKNTSAFENLGFARANDVKNYFISKGFPSNQITINGVVKDDGFVEKEGTVYGPVSFMIRDLASDHKEEDWAALKEKINANPLILYFKTGQATDNLTLEDRRKVADIVRYCDNVENSKIDAVGYTDNVGSNDKNLVLGQKRADFAKAYLVSNGIPAERIISTSKGATSPIGDETTAEGKAKNRRTVVTIN
jgi:OmpA-OmpF porin, OOP family